jgi:hypothetical protein
MEASSAAKREYGGKGRWVKYQARLGCWISLFYGPFSLCAHFETYEPFISLIFKIFSGRGKPRILNQWIRRHDCIQTNTQFHYHPYKILADKMRTNSQLFYQPH